MGNVNMEASQINFRGGDKKMSVETALKNATGEAAAIAQLQEDVADLNGSKANKADIATEFSDLTNYNAGDLVYYEGDLYEFQVDHTAGSWETSEVIQKDLSDIITTLKSGLTGYLNTRNATSAVIPSVVPGANIIPVNFASIIPPGMKPRFIGYNGNDKTLNIVAVNALQPLGDSDTQSNIVVYNPTQDTYTDVTFYACLGLVKA